MLRVSVFIIKNTISSIVIGWKNWHFAINLRPKLLSDSLLGNNHVQSCSLNQPIQASVSITVETLIPLSVY